MIGSSKQCERLKEICAPNPEDTLLETEKDFMMKEPVRTILRSFLLQETGSRSIKSVTAPRQDSFVITLAKETYRCTHNFEGKNIDLHDVVTAFVTIRSLKRPVYLAFLKLAGFQRAARSIVAGKVLSRNSHPPCFQRLEGKGAKRAKTSTEQEQDWEANAAIAGGLSAGSGTQHCSSTVSAEEVPACAAEPMAPCRSPEAPPPERLNRGGAVGSSCWSQYINCVSSISNF